MIYLVDVARGLGDEEQFVVENPLDLLPYIRSENPEDERAFYLRVVKLENRTAQPELAEKAGRL